jgi:hypothetical protein
MYRKCLLELSAHYPKCSGDVQELEWHSECNPLNGNYTLSLLFM